jgi:ammonia channel protein AmtB
MGAIVLGLIVGVVCLFFCTVIKNALGYDDSLDVFGVHCIGGIVGALGTGILVNPALGGTGIMDYTTGKIADYDFVAQMISQSWGVGRDQFHCRKIMAITADVASNDRDVLNCGMGTNKEIGQHAGSQTACVAVSPECLAGQK